MYRTLIIQLCQGKYFSILWHIENMESPALLYSSHSTLGHTMIDLRSTNNQHLVILGNLEILCWTSPWEVARLVTLCHLHYNPLTTEELRRPIKGMCPAEHWLPVFLHMSLSVFGLVDNFTSVRPFPHADEHTSQRKAKIPVNSRS